MTIGICENSCLHERLPDSPFEGEVDADFFVSWCTNELLGHAEM